MTAKTYEWSFALKLPSGHTLFGYPEPGYTRYAIADESGSTPEATDDGVLWINRNYPILIGTEDAGFGVMVERITLPLLTENGEATRTIIDFRTALLISAKCNMAIRWSMGAGDFYVKKV